MKTLNASPTKQYLMHGIKQVAFSLGVISIGFFLGFLAVTLLKRSTTFDDFWIVESGLIAGLAAASAGLFFAIYAAIRPSEPPPPR